MEEEGLESIIWQFALARKEILEVEVVAGEEGEEIRRWKPCEEGVRSTHRFVAPTSRLLLCRASRIEANFKG